MKNGSGFGRVVMESPQSRLLPTNYAACRGAQGATTSSSKECQQRGSRRRSVGRGLMQRRVPGVVAVEPAGIGVAFLHPGVGAGDRLHHRGARLAMRLVAAERALDVI